MLNIENSRVRLLVSELQYLDRLILKLPTVFLKALDKGSQIVELGSASGY